MTDPNKCEVHLDPAGVIAAVRECARITAPQVTDKEFEAIRAANDPLFANTVREVSRTIRAYLSAAAPAGPGEQSAAIDALEAIADGEGDAQVIAQQTLEALPGDVAKITRHFEAEAAKLREALEPFAEVISEYDPEDEDDFTPATLVVGSVTDYSLTLGDLRRARQALADKEME